MKVKNTSEMLREKAVENFARDLFLRIVTTENFMDSPETVRKAAFRAYEWAEEFQDVTEHYNAE